MKFEIKRICTLPKKEKMVHGRSPSTAGCYDEKQSSHNQPQYQKPRLNEPLLSRSITVKEILSHAIANALQFCLWLVF
jgi:hypothetical protein